jgi:phage replication O-like protein O
MASPQLENGHLLIANELAEVWSRKRISGEEWQVLWVILRKTYGWHKKEDKISLSQFSAATDLSRQAVQRAITKLLASNVISVLKNGYRKPNIYKLNKNFDTWVFAPKKGVLKNGARLYPFLRHTKDTTTKDNIPPGTDKYTLNT